MIGFAWSESAKGSAVESSLGNGSGVSRKGGGRAAQGGFLTSPDGKQLDKIQIQCYS